MKRLISIFLLCLLLTACGQPASEPAPTSMPATAPTQETVTCTLYLPNENADGFYEQVAILEALNAQQIVDQLISAAVLHEGILVNWERLEGTQLHVDFNAAFRDQLMTYGTAGELMMIGSVVNSLLRAYEADSVMLTVEGDIFESGHVIYDFPLEFYE